LQGQGGDFDFVSIPITPVKNPALSHKPRQGRGTLKTVLALVVVLRIMALLHAFLEHLILRLLLLLLSLLHGFLLLLLDFVRGRVFPVSGVVRLGERHDAKA
jgi:hypothetical protein